MIVRVIRRKLREVDRNSRQVRRGWADRALGVAFACSAILAPLIVYQMESWVVRRRSEPIALFAVYSGLGGSEVAAVHVRDPDSRIKFPPMSNPLAEVLEVQDRSWHGWPLVTRSRAEEPRFVAKLLPACPPSREPEVLEAARIALRLDLPRHQSQVATLAERIHVGGWIFSIGAWWMMLTATAWLVLLPLRFGREVHRVARNAVRQGRINRCHCPNCGYNAKESIQTGRCPECGGDLYERPDW